MTGDGLLSKRDLADERGRAVGREIAITTISRALTASRRRLREGLPLRETDLPVNDGTAYGYPKWRRTPELEAWLTRPGQPPRVAQSTGKDET